VPIYLNTLEIQLNWGDFCFINYILFEIRLNWGDFCICISVFPAVEHLYWLIRVYYWICESVLCGLWSPFYGTVTDGPYCVLPLLTTSTWFCDALPLANCWHGNLWMILSVDRVHRLTQTHSGGWFGDCMCLPQQWNYHTINSQEIAICTLFHTYWQMKWTFIIQIADMHIENS
jgi:hypothetical protein